MEELDFKPKFSSSGDQNMQHKATLQIQTTATKMDFTVVFPELCQVHQINPDLSQKKYEIIPLYYVLYVVI